MNLAEFQERLLPMAGEFTTLDGGRIRHKTRKYNYNLIEDMPPLPCCPIEALFDTSHVDGVDATVRLGRLLGLNDSDIETILRTSDNMCDNPFFSPELYLWFVQILCNEVVSYDN